MFAEILFSPFGFALACSVGAIPLGIVMAKFRQKFFAAVFLGYGVGFFPFLGLFFLLDIINKPGFYFYAVYIPCILVMMWLCYVLLTIRMRPKQHAQPKEIEELQTEEQIHPGQYN